MANDYINKPVGFKKSDKKDMLRYKFSQGLPNFTQAVKDMLDWMKQNGLKTFEAPGAAVERQTSREFTRIDPVVSEEEFESEEADGEVDARQFL